MSFRGWAWAGLLSLLGAGGVAGEAWAGPTPALPAAVAKTIARDVEALLHRFGAPGATVMVLQDGRVSFLEAFGVRDVARGLPVSTTTSFEIGSITKQFTAASILQLQEAGKLQIDQPLATYLPDAPHAREVTLRQLLAHTSGLHDYLDGPQAEMDRLVPRPATYEELIARVAARPLDFPPGSRWSYSNTGYLLLGKVIETVSGERYGAYLHRHIFVPLGMKDAVTTAELGRLPNAAIGYRRANGQLERAPVIAASWGGAAGFLVMPLSDLARWDAALRDGRVVSPESYRAMTTAFMTTQAGTADYGLGLFLNPVFGQPRIGHTGGTLGSTTADEYFPRQGLRIIAFTNLGDSPEAGEALTNVVFADLHPEIVEAAQRSAPGEDPAITRLVLDAFRQLQAGAGYARFAPKLRDKLAAGRGAKFATDLGAYGAPSGATFKGVRQEAKETWSDYVIRFGPGVFLPFAVTVGPEAVVTSFSVG